MSFCTGTGPAQNGPALIAAPCCTALFFVLYCFGVCCVFVDVVAYCCVYFVFVFVSSCAIDALFVFIYSVCVRCVVVFVFICLSLLICAHILFVYSCVVDMLSCVVVIDTLMSSSSYSSSFFLIVVLLDSLFSFWFVCCVVLVCICLHVVFFLCLVLL